MEEENETFEGAAPPRGIGAQLRAAREAMGLTVEQVAAQTRIPQRHLHTIEEGAFAQLPGRTYAVGFSRTYAKTVGLDQDDVVAMVRAELDEQSALDERPRPATFEPGDPARVPSRGLGWFAVFALLLLLAGGFFFFREMFAPAGELPSLVAEAEPEPPAAAGKAGAGPGGDAIDPSGEVVFTSLMEGTWVKFYDANGRQLMQKEMALGETYTLPADAEGPQLWTGRPYALAITVGGQPVAKITEQDTVVRDVPVSAAALLARPSPTPAPAPAATGENRAPPAT